MVLFFILTSLTSLKAKNEYIDSLKGVLSKVNNAQNNNNLYLISKAYLFENTDSSYIYVNQLISESKICKDSVNLANGFNLLGIYYYKKYINHKAFYNFHKAAKLFLHSNDTIGLAKCYNNMGIILKREKDYEKAMIYYRKSLKYHKVKNNSLGVAGAYQSIAVLHKHLENYDSASVFYQKSIKIKQALKDKRGLSIVYLNYGNLLRYTNQKDSCFYYLNKTLEMRKAAGWESKIMKAYIVLAKAFYAYGELDSAKKYALTVSEFDNVKLKRDAAEILAQVYEDLGDYKSSVENHKYYLQIRDSLDKAEEVSDILEQERVFNLEVLAKKQQIKKAKAHAELLRKQNLQYLLIVLVIGLAFVLFFVFGLSNVKPIIINPFIVILLLMTFEFILVYTEPYVDKIADNNPSIKLGINMLIALVLIPLHGFLDRVMKKRVE